MLTSDQLKQLKSENELLQLQLDDVNYMISIREDELEILRNKAKQAIKLQSQLEGTFDQLQQLQNIIGEKQQQVAGSNRREAAMENEILQSISIEKEYYTIQSKFASANAALTDVNLQLAESAQVYKQLAIANARIAELESSLEIASEEKELLQYDLMKMKKQNEKLLSGL